MSGSGREGNERGKSSGRREWDTDSRRGLSRSSSDQGELTARSDGGRPARGKQGTSRGAKGREGRFRPAGRPGKGSRSEDQTPGNPPYGPGRESAAGRGTEAPGRQGSSSGGGREGVQAVSLAKGSDRSRGSPLQDTPRYDKKFPFFDRPKWTAPILSTEPMTHPDCPYCGKPIKDMFTAIADKDTGEAVHFECAAARIAEGETLEKGDAVTYLGGGRFGIVHFPGMIRDALRGRRGGDEYDTKNFRIKKIFEWEKTEDRSPWRKTIEEHFSVV